MRKEVFLPENRLETGQTMFVLHRANMVRQLSQARCLLMTRNSASRMPGPCAPGARNNWPMQIQEAALDDCQAIARLHTASWHSIYMRGREKRSASAIFPVMYLPIVSSSGRCAGVHRQRISTSFWPSLKTLAAASAPSFINSA